MEKGDTRQPRRVTAECESFSLNAALSQKHSTSYNGILESIVDVV